VSLQKLYISLNIKRKKDGKFEDSWVEGCYAENIQEAKKKLTRKDCDQLILTWEEVHMLYEDLREEYGFIVWSRKEVK